MKKKILVSLLFTGLLLASCNNSSSSSSGGNASYEPQDISSRDVDYPQTIEYSGNDSFAIHYRRSDNKYADWGLWLWDPNGEDDGEVDVFNYQDDFGVTAYYDISKIGDCNDGMGIIVRKLEDWTKDYDADRFIDFSAYTKDDNDCYHVYLYSGDGNIYSNPNKELADAVLTCEFVDESNVSITATNNFNEVYLYEGNQQTPISYYRGMDTNNYVAELPSEKTGDVSKPYWVSVKFTRSEFETVVPVSVANLYKTDSFEETYSFDGELGAIYSEASTTFRVWSPVSSSIKVRIYDSGTPTSVDAAKGSDAYAEYAMIKGSNGVFEAKLGGDLAGKFYTYVVTNGSFSDKEIVDPYAKSAGISGLRGQIVDFSKTNPNGWDNVDYLDYDRKELVVYETHVADVTSHSSWSGTEEYRRTFMGMAESGTSVTYRGSTVTTGFDHIKEMGVNAVQILPMFDQANDETTYTFNWGYNPLNYNVVEGMYSTDPYDGYARIRELKTLVSAYQQAGIIIIMDVVYNHVNGADNSNFDVLMPDYYFRLNADGTYSNGSGCGNETASEMPMMRKFIVDSATFWMEEYKLGGFRFDLMGLHDLTTMNELTAECKKINPNAVIYGEPWTAGTSTMEDFDSNSAKQSNGNKYEGYGQFNDAMRDALIRGGLNSAESVGWITNKTNVVSSDVNSITKGINGVTASNPNITDPNKTVNYVTCHDNYTLYDRMAAAGTPDTEYEQDMMCVSANAVVMTSNGTSFMQGGEEFLRTKRGNSNSYEAGDAVNQFDYRRKVTFAPVFEAYKGLVDFKKTCGALCTDSSTSIEVKTLDSGSVIYYELTDGTNQYMVVHANGYEPASGRSPLDLSGYNVYLDTISAWDDANIQKGDALTANYKMSKYETLIAIKA